jgi:transcriptional regulator with XRE-family HTH domain
MCHMVDDNERHMPSRLKLAIVASGFTSAQVAKMIGKDPGQLARWTSGSRECPQVARVALASVLETTVDELFADAPLKRDETRAAA